MNRMAEFVVTHLNVTVSDIARSAHFYENILGLRPVRASANSGRDAQGIAFDAEGLIIELVEQRPGKTAGRGEEPTSPFWHVGFQTGDVDALATHLRENSVRFAIEPMNARGGVRVCFFHDPDGALLEVIEGNLSFNDEEMGNRERAEGALALPLRIHHVALQVADRAGSADTLAESFGFEQVGEISYPENDLDISFVSNGRVMLELFEFGDEKGPGRFIDESERWRFDVFAVPDTAAAGGEAIALRV